MAAEWASLLVYTLEPVTAWALDPASGERLDIQLVLLSVTELGMELDSVLAVQLVSSKETALACESAMSLACSMA